MTAASGADREPGWVHDPDDVCVRPCCGPTLPASGADQPTLRDQLANEIRSRWVLRGDAGAGKIVDALLPLIEADRERAKAEGGAEALEKAAREDSVGTHNLTPIEVLTLRVVKVYDLWTRAAALRGTAGHS